MRFVYILEDDQKFQKEIAEALFAIDQRIQSRFFNNLMELFEWFQIFTKTGSRAISSGGQSHSYVKQELSFENEENHIAMIIFKDGIILPSHLGMLQKLQKSFVEHNVCSKENPTRFVITAFDDPSFQISSWAQPGISNVIFKPFDKVILQQHLIYALAGHMEPTLNVLERQQAKVYVELLKEIQIDAISDVGFLSSNEQEIPVGSICKYYGSMFLTEKHRSVFARCVKSELDPKNPKKYISTFLYFALDQSQITNLRKYSRSKDLKALEYRWAPLEKKFIPEFNLILLDEEEHRDPVYIPKILNMFSGVKVIHYKSFASLIADLDPTSQEAQDLGFQELALDGFSEVQLVFDQLGKSFISAVGDGKVEPKALFSIPMKDLRNKLDWFASLLSEEDRDIYRRVVHSGNIRGEGIYSIDSDGSSFQVKMIDVKKDSGKIIFTFKELSKEERLEYLKTHSKLNKPIHLILTNQISSSPQAEIKWNRVRAICQEKFQLNPKIIVVSKENFPENTERILSDYFDDILYKTLDPVYLMQKIKVFYPALSERVEKVKYSTVSTQEKLKTVNQVKISEISEAGFVMDYYRSLPSGSFREVVLPKANELESPEVLAVCNYVEEVENKEKDKDKISYKCHFIFFGPTDTYLKKIRLWIVESYVQGKEQQAS